MTIRRIVELIRHLSSAGRRKLFESLREEDLLDEQALEAVDPECEKALREELQNLLWLRGKEFGKALKSQRERERILQYLQWCDELESVTGGALLGFSGILLAADLVLLSAESSSCIALVGPRALPAFITIIPLSIAAILALTTFVTLRHTGKKYALHVNSLGSFCRHVQHRTRLNYLAKWFAIVGVALFVTALSLKFYYYLASGMVCPN